LVNSHAEFPFKHLASWQASGHSATDNFAFAANKYSTGGGLEMFSLKDQGKVELAPSLTGKYNFRVMRQSVLTALLLSFAPILLAGNGPRGGFK
jgi:hypothetical protein